MTTEQLTVAELLDSDFAWDELEIDDEEFERLSSALIIDFLKKHDPLARQQLVVSWNFDNGKDVLQWIAQQPDTDQGTILLLYWYMNPQFFKKYQDREDCLAQDSDWILEDFDLVETIERNYLANFYQGQKYAFDPRNDPYNGHYNWTNELDETEQKRAIPKKMYEPLPGEIIACPNWTEGIPDELEPIMDKLCEALDEDN